MRPSHTPLLFPVATCHISSSCTGIVLFGFFRHIRCRKFFCHKFFYNDPPLPRLFIPLFRASRAVEFSFYRRLAVSLSFYSIAGPSSFCRDPTPPFFLPTLAFLVLNGSTFSFLPLLETHPGSLARLFFFPSFQATGQFPFFLLVLSSARDLPLEHLPQQR